MSEQERVVPDVVGDATDPDAIVDPIPDDAGFVRKPVKRVRKPRKRR